MNPIVEKVYQIGIIPVIAFNSVDEALPLCNPYVTSTGKSYPLALLHITHPDSDHVRNAERICKELEPYLLCLSLIHIYSEVIVNFLLKQ